uniref:Uncharacterized protein n=1 Tax=Vespula pensylvanica TaxID=30213 RepID=A0A834P7J4_VESPE|nr:hypothetical protein H0235_004639 [Vespula pensylvanica]
MTNNDRRRRRGATKILSGTYDENSIACSYFQDCINGKPERRRVAYSLGIQHNYRGFAKASAERKITARVSLAFNVPIKIATGNLALLG